MSSSSVTTIEGEVEFPVKDAGKQCKTWYKIVGDLTSNRRPLVTLHGGPGVQHMYLLPMAEFATRYGIPVIFYDQLGNGKSTHLPEKKGDTSFWTEQLFLDQLDHLLRHLKIQDNYDLLGHSWGGMLASRHATKQPAGLQRLVIVSSPADMGMWVEAQDLLREKLPPDVQQTLKHHEEVGTTDSKEYTKAVEVFYERHLCLVQPMPAPLAESLTTLESDPTVYHTMNGPSEFHVIGSLKTWSMLKEAHKIKATTLLVNGKFDEAQDSTVLPFFQLIQKVKWVTLQKSSHMSHFEEPERFLEVVGGFLVNV